MRIEIKSRLAKIKEKVENILFLGTLIILGVYGFLAIGIGTILLISNLIK